MHYRMARILGNLLNVILYLFLGIGACHIGGASGPLTKNRPGHSHVQWVLSDTCPVEGMD